MTASIVTILPAYIVAVVVPNAFITILGFAGMILVIIAILLPVYLLYKAKINNLLS
ncbi:tryptophan/tyrosine permease family protein [Rickettsia amblyommatis str. Ac/Pa]|uniref:Tryptophan/tyrosine permease family protein n=4 Tax=spotted fever group TaxID=114277 RepID=A0A0F3N2R8_RICAM|nr:tryptophan/tyrosine permease family protein [Rickettsia amblyommatis str. Ac/Pa]